MPMLVINQDKTYLSINPNITSLNYTYNFIENDDITSFTSELTNSTNVTKVRGIPLIANGSIQTGITNI